MLWRAACCSKKLFRTTRRMAADGVEDMEYQPDLRRPGGSVDWIATWKYFRTTYECLTLGLYRHIHVHRYATIRIRDAIKVGYRHRPYDTSCAYDYANLGGSFAVLQYRDEARRLYFGTQQRISVGNQNQIADNSANHPVAEGSTKPLVCGDAKNEFCDRRQGGSAGCLKRLTYG